MQGLSLKISNNFAAKNNNKYGNAMLICAIRVNLWLFLSIYKQLPRA
jgi:hypothetical protein